MLVVRPTLPASLQDLEVLFRDAVGVECLSDDESYLLVRARVAKFFHEFQRQASTLRERTRATAATRVTIARPKISRNEWNAAELGAFEVEATSNHDVESPVSRPGARRRGEGH